MRNYNNYKSMRTAYNNVGISLKRADTLRKSVLSFYKWLKKNRHQPITYQVVQQTAGAKSTAEKQFVSQYFQWLANRFGRV